MRHPTKLSVQIGLVSLVLVASDVTGQTIHGQATFHTTSTMVLVPVTVTDRNGKTVLGLGPNDFQVFDERTPQPIVSFLAQDSPCSVGLVLDTSGSMKDTLASAKDVARAFMESSNSEDEFFLMTVSTSPHVITGFTHDAGTIENALAQASPGGWTALIDTVTLGLDYMRKARRPRHALLVVSDGIDNHSDFVKSELMERAVEADTQIYTIVIDNAPPYRKAIELTEERRGREFLMDLAERTGGIHLTVRGRDDVGGAAARIASAIRNQYVIGYQPQTQGPSGKWRHIRVLAGLRGVTVYARNGYFGQ